MILSFLVYNGVGRNLGPRAYLPEPLTTRPILVASTNMIHLKMSINMCQLKDKKLKYDKYNFFFFFLNKPN
jgi:hypothetical protein